MQVLNEEFPIPAEIPLTKPIFSQFFAFPRDRWNKLNGQKVITEHAELRPVQATHNNTMQSRGTRCTLRLWLKALLTTQHANRPGARALSLSKEQIEWWVCARLRVCVVSRMVTLDIVSVVVVVAGDVLHQKEPSIVKWECLRVWNFLTIYWINSFALDSFSCVLHHTGTLYTVQCTARSVPMPCCRMLLYKSVTQTTFATIYGDVMLCICTQREFR